MSEKLENLPLYSITAKILKFLAFAIDVHWRCYIYLTCTTIFNILQITYLVVSENELTKQVVTLFMMVLWLAANVRVYVLIRNRNQMNAFLSEINSMYMDIMKNGDKLTKDMLKDTTRSARNVAYFNFLLGIFSCIGMLVSSVMERRRELIFDMYLPFYDERKLETPFFEIIYPLQFLLLPLGSSMFMSFSNLIIALLFFNIFMCKVLQKELRGLNIIPTANLTKKLIQCVNFHNTISDYIGRINNLATYVYALEFVLFGTLLCVLLFLLIILKTVYEQMIMLPYIMMIFAQLAVIYFYANSMYFESLGVADAAYDTNWYEYNGKTRMTLKLIMQRAQKPICLTMGNFHPMTLEVLKTLLNITYSYFTILRNMIQ